MADFQPDLFENPDFYLLLPLTQNDDYLESLRDLLATGKDPNCQTSCYDFRIFPQGIHGNTLLQVATNSTESNLGAIRELINAGADVNLANSEGYTPLHFAVKRRKHDVFDLLLQSGGHLSINAQTYYRQTPLQFAIDNYEDDSPPDVWIIRKLLEYEDINVNTTDYSLLSPLMMAVRANCLEAVELLLSKGANPDIAMDFYEGTCLHTALFSLHPNYDIVRQLLLHGADIYRLNYCGHTPIDMLIENIRDDESFRFAMRCLKMVVLRFHIRDYFIVKLHKIPKLPQFVEKCCEEVQRMKSDKITDSFTLHHFLLYRCEEKYFREPQLQLYLPVVQKLVHGFYREYFYDIFDRISDSNLCKLLDIIVRSRTSQLSPKKENYYVNLFSKMDIIGFCKYLPRLDTFSLIAAFSNVRITETLQDLARGGLDICPI